MRISAAVADMGIYVIMTLSWEQYLAIRIQSNAGKTDKRIFKQGPTRLITRGVQSIVMIDT